MLGGRSRLVGIILLLSLDASASAEVVDFVDATGGSWKDGANWESGTPPGTDDHAGFRGPAGLWGTLQAGDTAVCSGIAGPGWDAGDIRLDVEGTIWLLGDWEGWGVHMGQAGSGNSLNVRGSGSLLALHGIRIGNGMGTGQVSITDNASAQLGQLEINDGCTVDIRRDGRLILSGDKQTEVANWVAARRITAYGGLQAVIVSYNASATTVTALRPAGNPNPHDGKTCVDPHAVLSWSAANAPVSYDVYLGDDLDEVNDANTSSNAYVGRQDGTTYDPGGLEDGRTYYWRIDEFDGSDVWKGTTWRFTVALWPTRSDTWVATDALGRSLPTSEEVGPRRADRHVGIFYFLWLGQHGTTGPYNISEILDADPNALDAAATPPWGGLWVYHHWGEPLFGYYLSDDEYVIRKHGQMLADAGVDTLIFDVSNAFTYHSSYMAVLRVFSDMRQNGAETPQVAFLVPFDNPGSAAQKLYTNLYEPGLYSDLWYRWEGKPLIMADPEGVSSTLRDFFTFRRPVSNYLSGPSGPNQWGWLEVFPQHVFYSDTNSTEQMAVSIAQNAWGTHAPAAFSEAISHGQPCYGRSWHDGAKDLASDAANHGYNFAEQWQRALEVDPSFVFITGWNEWVAARLSTFNGVSHPVMFVDVVNQEYSRDIEPMKGGHTDSYYYQMVDYVWRYKGVSPPPQGVAYTSIAIDGEFADWSAVPSVYRDDVGDTMHRDHPGWGSEGQCVNTTGRNDFVELKVAVDSDDVYFYARTDDAITPCTDPDWMMLFINSDRDHSTGWQGYDFVVNRTIDGATATVLEHSAEGWDWQHAGQVQYRVSGNELELALPRSSIGQAGPLEFEFKWADNMQAAGDVLEFSLSGDAAPNNRFNYLVRFAAVLELAATVNSDSWGHVQADPNDASYAIGTVVTLTPHPADGFAFYGWAGDVPEPNVTDNPLQITMDASKSITAYFIPEGGLDPNDIRWRFRDGPWHTCGAGTALPLMATSITACALASYRRRRRKQ